MPRREHTAATVRWPLSDDDWREILRFLSPEADRAAVRQVIEDAVREFIEGQYDQEFHDQCWRITRAARARPVQEFFRLVLQVKDFPLDPDTAAYLQHVEALVDAGPPKPPKPPKKALAARYQAIERLRSRFSRAWTDRGQGEMPISANSPFADFFYALTSRVLPPGLEGEGIKAFVRRETRQRKRLHRLTKHKGVNLTIDEGLVYIIDSTGQRRPQP